MHKIRAYFKAVTTKIQLGWIWNLVILESVRQRYFVIYFSIKNCHKAIKFYAPCAASLSLKPKHSSLLLCCMRLSLVSEVCACTKLAVAALRAAKRRIVKTRELSDLDDILAETTSTLLRISVSALVVFAKADQPVAGKRQGCFMTLPWMESSLFLLLWAVVSHSM